MKAPRFEAVIDGQMAAGKTFHQAVAMERMLRGLQ